MPPRLRFKRIYLVVSLKGGVGKSTVACSLAWFLRNRGKTTLWDLDINSPSCPKILGVQGNDLVIKKYIEPYEIDENLSVMSVDFLLPDRDQPIVFKAGRKSSIIRQFAESVDFGRPDYLVLDTPPTTSEELLTILEMFPKSKMSIIFVTEPSAVSENGVIKSIRMLSEKGYPINGLISNKDGFRCPHCGEIENDIYPVVVDMSKVAKDYDIPFLGRIPLKAKTTENGILIGEDFIGIAEEILTAKPVEHKERFSKRGLIQKARAAHQIWKSFTEGD